MSKSQFIKIQFASSDGAADELWGVYSASAFKRCFLLPVPFPPPNLFGSALCRHSPLHLLSPPKVFLVRRYVGNHHSPPPPLLTTPRLPHSHLPLNTYPLPTAVFRCRWLLPSLRLVFSVSIINRPLSSLPLTTFTFPYLLTVPISTPQLVQCRVAHLAHHRPWCHWSPHGPASYQIPATRLPSWRLLSVVTSI